MCGLCHTCGTALQTVLDGEEWCALCHAYRRYRSHGWAKWGADNSPCVKENGRWSDDLVFPSTT